MNFKNKKAVGIDIRSDRVSFVELQDSDGQIRFVRSRTAPLPEGAVANGTVQDASAVASVLKSMKFAGTLKHCDAALTVCGEPVLLQILNLPELSPAEAKKFIRDEVRQYAILPLKNVEMDYCGLRPCGSQGKRVLVGAGQSEHLNSIARAVEKENINLKSVEPAVTSLIRACYNKVIKPAGDKNVMFLLLGDRILTLCIFSKGKLEFLRTKTLGKKIETLGDRNDFIVRQVCSVIEFYEIEEETMICPWQIVVSGCGHDENAAIADQVKSGLTRQDVKVGAFNNSMTEVLIENSDSDVCPVATGLAMNLLNANPSRISINLLPKEVAAIKKARKEMLVIVNVAACIFFLLFAYIAFLGKKSADIGQNNYVHKQQQLDDDMQKAIAERGRVNAELKIVEENLLAIEESLQDRNYQNWAKLLARLAGVVPQTVLIENLQGGDSDVMTIEGVAVNYDAVSGFVNKLSGSEIFASALLCDTSQQNRLGQGFINYSISCSLAE